MRALLVGLVVAVFAATAASQASPPPATLALLVGINEYAKDTDGDAPASLKGPHNDVERAAEVLVTRFGFAPESIVKLVGKQATHEAIVSRFHSHLIERAGPKTRVVFWFSGHGARVPDASKRDPSPRPDGAAAMDDTFVAYDSRAVDPTGGHDITDDELHSLLAAVRSRDIVVVTDCCHSGGMLRGELPPGTRQCAPGTTAANPGELAFWPDEVPFRDDAAGNQLTSVVHIAACGAQQEAGEYQVATGWHGTLTWFLCRTLQRIDREASWHEVAMRTRASAAGKGDESSQVVQIGGDGKRAVFGGRGRPLPAGYDVQRYGTRGLLIAAGHIHGLRVGGQLSILGLDGTELGTAEVDRVGTSSSEARWQGRGRPPRQPMFAQLQSLGRSAIPLRIAIDGIDSSVLAKSPYAEVTDRETAEYVLQRTGNALTLSSLSSTRATVVRRTAADEQALHLTLFREHCFRSLWTGVAGPGRYPIEIAVQPADEAEVARLGLPAALVRPGIVGADILDPNQRPSGGLVQLVVSNHSDEDLHIAIVAVSENREAHVLFGRDKNNVVASKQDYKKTAWLGPSADWPKDRSMIDRYIAIATPRHADFLPFESEAPLAAMRGTADDDLPPFLQKALSGTRTRGDMERRPWGIAFCDVQVVTKAIFAATQ